MKIGRILAAAIAAMGVLSCLVVFFGGEEDNSGEIAAIWQDLEIHSNKKMYFEAVQDYQRLIALNNENYELVLEYKEFCKENGFEAECAGACLRAMDMRPDDFESAKDYLQWLESSNSKEIYTFVQQKAATFTGEQSEYFSDYYDSIRGSYKRIVGSLAGLSPWFSNIIYYPADGGGVYPLSGGEVYTLAKNESGKMLAFNASGTTIANNDDIMSYSMTDNLIAAVDDGQAVYIASDRRRIVPYDPVNKLLINYDYLGPYSGGLANYNNGGDWGYINKDAVSCVSGFEKASPFMNGVAAVKKDGKWGFIKYNSESGVIELTGYIYDDVYLDGYGYPLCCGYGYVKKSGVGGWSLVRVLMNEERNSIIGITEVGDKTFEDVRPFGRYGAAMSGGKWGFLNEFGDWVIESAYDDAYSLMCGLAPVKINGMWGYIDAVGKVIIEPQFDEAQPFNSNGIAPVSVNGVWELIQLVEYVYQLES